MLLLVLVAAAMLSLLLLSLHLRSSVQGPALHQAPAKPMHTRAQQQTITAAGLRIQHMHSRVVCWRTVPPYGAECRTGRTQETD